MLLRVIDIGSNSVKASLYLVEEGAHRQVGKDKLDYAIGDSVFADGAIPEAGMDKVIAFINRLPHTHDGEKAHFTFVVATSAVRSASNRDAFVRKLQLKTGLEVRVLSGGEESYLIHMGILSRTDAGPEDVVKTIDIGGGSAEVSWTRGQRYLFGHSYELGAIRLARKFLNGKPYTADAFARIHDHALGELGRYPIGDPPPADKAIGSSGNVRAVARMIEEMRGDSVAKLLPAISPGALEDLIEIALGRTPDKLASLFHLETERARIIMPAVVVLLATLRHFSIRRLEVTEFGLREGVIHYWSRHGHLNLPITGEEASLEGQVKDRKAGN